MRGLIEIIMYAYQSFMSDSNSEMREYTLYSGQG